MSKTNKGSPPQYIETKNISEDTYFLSREYTDNHEPHLKMTRNSNVVGSPNTGDIVRAQSLMSYSEYLIRYLNSKARKKWIFAGEDAINKTNYVKKYYAFIEERLNLTNAPYTGDHLMNILNSFFDKQLKSTIQGDEQRGQEIIRSNVLKNLSQEIFGPKRSSLTNKLIKLTFT